ncbi:hypothetical protein JHK82_047663 [Glycine max]|nr:hypothetical protein JHK82_047663 [Glycine max]
MEAYSGSYSSSSNSSYLTQNNREDSKGYHMKQQIYPLQNHSSSWLRSVRKTPAKPWKKHHVAPMPPTPVKVYKVDAINFREVVQQLTGAPKHKPQQLLQINIARAESSDAPLDVPPKQNQSSGDTCNKWYQEFLLGMNSPGTNNNNDDGAMTPGFLGMNLLSPNSYSNYFCFFPPLSPSGVTSLEPGKVL